MKAISIPSPKFPFFHPHEVKESNGRKSLNNKEKNNSLSILSLFHPHPLAYPPARMCVSDCECPGERMKVLAERCNPLSLQGLRHPIHSLIPFLSPSDRRVWTVFTVPPPGETRRDARGNGRLVHHSLFCRSGFAPQAAQGRVWSRSGRGFASLAAPTEWTRPGATWRERGATLCQEADAGRNLTHFSPTTRAAR